MKDNLTEEFQKYVGAIVKNPERMTCDCDTTAGEELAGLAHKNGLFLIFKKAGERQEPFMGDANYVSVTLSKDGVPDADKGWGWRVAGITVSA